MIENVALALITSAWHLKSYFQSHQLVEDELSHKAGLAKAWTHREDGGMVHQTFRIWPSLWTLRPHEDTIQGWLSGRIHWKQKNHPRLVEPLHRQCVQCKGIILKGPDHVTLEQALSLNFKASNNQVEYETFIASLKLATKVGPRSYDSTQTRNLSKDRLPTGTRPRK